MKTALVCIALGEDRYIEEWVSYHLKLGFDDVILCLDEWNPSVELGDRVKFINNIRKNGAISQVGTYNYALTIIRDEYDFIAFFDMDEFLVLKKHACVKEFLADKQTSVGINWLLFGDNGLEDDGSNGVLKRFTKCQSIPNQHVKCIVKYSPNIKFFNPHCANELWLGSDGEMHDYAFCENGNIEVAQLNHYFCRTPQEWKLKQARGHDNCRGGVGYRPDSDFDIHNFNEVDDFSARDFLYNN